MHCSYVAQHSSRHRLRHSPRVSWRRPWPDAFSQRAAQPAKHWRYLCGNQPVRRAHSGGEEPASPRHRAGVASNRRGGRPADSARTRHKILIPHRQVRAVFLRSLRVALFARAVGVLAAHVRLGGKRRRRRSGRRGGRRTSDETSSRRQRHVDAARASQQRCNQHPTHHCSKVGAAPQPVFMHCPNLQAFRSRGLSTANMQRF